MSSQSPQKAHTTPLVICHWQILLLIAEKSPGITTVPEAIKDRSIQAGCQSILGRYRQYYFPSPIIPGKEEQPARSTLYHQGGQRLDVDYILCSSQVSFGRT